MKLPSFNDIQQAHSRIRRLIHRTPVFKCDYINKQTGAEIFFKCENFQKVGAFKFRGACNAVLSLNEEEKKSGVATHSSGNHAQALTLAAGLNGVKAHIVMPDNSPIAKKEATAGYGAQIYFCEPTLTAREETLSEVVKKTGAVFVHPYNNFKVISGQGTAAKELIEDCGEFDIVMAPVGGGGLLSGTSISVKALAPITKVIAGEPLGADDAERSFKTGMIVPSVAPKTICDGLLTSLGEMTFAIIREKVDDIITVDDEWTIIAMKMIWERMKIIVEPSSAVPLGALLQQREKFGSNTFTKKKIGIILSGGNVDFNNLPWLDI